MARVAEGLGVAWNTANDAVLTEGKRILIEDTTRFDGVTAVGVSLSSFLCKGRSLQVGVDPVGVGQG